MLRLRTFGGLWLEGPDGPVNGTATRRRLALLTIIAAAGRQGMSRDRLLSILWSESDQNHARHALTQTIYSMRRDFLGETPVCGVADLRLNLDALSADVMDFEDALAAGDAARASALYTGPFLDGFHLYDAPEFERWIDERRSEYQVRAVQAYETVARASERAGDLVKSVECWRKLASLDPYNGRVAQELMTALARAGDRAGAMTYSRVYATRVRAEIGTEPDQAVLRLADSLAKEGGSLFPQNVIPAAESSGTVVPTAPAVSDGTSGRRTRSVWIVAGAVVLLGVSAAALVVRPDRIRFQERDWIVLADLENHTGDTLLDQTLVAAATAGLSQSRYVNVFPQNWLRETLLRMQADTARPFDEERAREVAMREGLRAVLVLHVGTVSNAYALTARLVEPGSGVEMEAWTRRADEEGALLSTLDGLLRDVRRSIGESRAEIAERSYPLPAVTTHSLEALRYFTNGAVAWSEGRWPQAQEQWLHAVRLDSSFARAHQALGSLFYWLGNRSVGEEHFAKALAVVDRLPERERLWIEARVAGSRGNPALEADRWSAYLGLYPDDRDGWYNLATALKQAGRCGEAIVPFERAIDLDDEMAPAFINLATCYESLGRYDQGIASFQQAFHLRPEERTRTAGDINRLYGFLLLKAGDSAGARATFAELLSGDPVQRANGQRSLGLFEMYFGRYEQAITHLREAVLLNRAARHGLSEYRNRLYLANAYAAKGQDAEAWNEIETATGLAIAQTFSPTWVGFLVRYYARAGDLESAERVVDVMEERTHTESTADRSAMHNARGEIALAHGRSAEALDAFELAYRLTPSEHHLEPLARALQLIGDRERARDRYLELIAERPLGWEPQEAWVLARFHLGRLHEDLGDPATAGEYYKELLTQWADGGVDLVVLRDARGRLAALGQEH